MRVSLFSLLLWVIVLCINAADARGGMCGRTVAGDIRDGTVAYAELHLLPQRIDPLSPLTPDFVMKHSKGIRVGEIGGRLRTLAGILEKMTCEESDDPVDLRSGIVFYDKNGAAIHSVFLGEGRLFGGVSGIVDGKVYFMDGLLQNWVRSMREVYGMDGGG